MISCRPMMPPARTDLMSVSERFRVWAIFSAVPETSFLDLKCSSISSISV